MRRTYASDGSMSAARSSAICRMGRRTSERARPGGTWRRQLGVVGGCGAVTNANQTSPSPRRSGVSVRWRRNIVSDVVQGIIAGVVLAFITFQILAHAYVTKVDGWTTIYGCGEPGNGVLLRAACALTFPGPINVPQEAVYWITKVDSKGQKLSGKRDEVDSGGDCHQVSALGNLDAGAFLATEIPQEGRCPGRTR
jgi:hypothetical protein